MLDKSHCRLADGVVKSEELGEFWESESGSEENDEQEQKEKRRFILASRVEEETRQLHLPSGRTLGHRSNARSLRQYHARSDPKFSDQKTIEDNTNAYNNGNGNLPEAGSSTSLSLNTPTNRGDRRAAMALTRSDHANKGLIGLSESEMRAVRATEKKLAKMEVRARNLYAARVERGANKQKYFKVR